MIRECNDADFEAIFEIINAAAQAYRDVIPADRWHDPYMSREQLAEEIKDGVSFWGFVNDGQLTGIMGIQDKGDVTLIRHAYVRPSSQKQGAGTILLHHLERTTEKPVLIGTWADATWAIAFYQKHGYQAVDQEQKNWLLKKYWTIPDRQVETSIVLVDSRWKNRAVRKESF